MIEAVLKEHNAVGIENALTITELCILTGKTIREITKAVEDERKSGVLICSRMEGKGGYFMPANDVEIQSQLASFERRIRFFGTDCLPVAFSAGYNLSEQ